MNTSLKIKEFEDLKMKYRKGDRRNTMQVYFKQQRPKAISRRYQL